MGKTPGHSSGRRRTVDILDCYLQQNLARNGGYVDQVQFLLHTTDQADISYINQLASQTAEYRVLDPGDCTGNNYGCMWESLVGDDTIYVKIDDDVVGYLSPIIQIFCAHQQFRCIFTKMPYHSL